jgi:hypothetical protein
VGLLAETDSLHVLFGYGGQSTNGIYPRSQTRLRRVLGRLTYWQPGWSARLQYMYNEHGQDIHGGVVQQGSLITLFQPVGAQVDRGEARRSIMRHDLMGRFDLFWQQEADPLTIRGFWTNHRLHYQELGQSLEAKAHRRGGQIRQTAAIGAHRITADADFWWTRIASGNGLTGDQGVSEFEYHLTASDSARWSFGSVYARTGWHGRGNLSYGSGTLRLSHRIGWLNGRLEGSTSGYAPSWVERYGFGTSVSSGGAFDDSRYRQLQARLDGTVGTVTAGVEASVRRWENPVLFMIEPDNGAVFSQLHGTDDWLTVSGNLGWRLSTDRGVRLSLTPSIFQPLQGAETITDRRISESLPDAAIDAKFGVRYQLFQDDLDASVYLHGRGWTSMRSRTYDPSTALFPLPAVDARRWGPFGTVDLQVEGRIRNSTVFFAYQNILDGLVHPGSLVVPTYPLPARFLRFGVFWPLFG